MQHGNFKIWYRHEFIHEFYKQNMIFLAEFHPIDIYVSAKNKLLF